MAELSKHYKESYGAWAGLPKGHAPKLDRCCEEVAKRIEADLLVAMMGPPQPPKRPTAIRMRAGRFETVELDDAGNVIEPPPPCCHGGVLHAPNCKSWFYCT